MEKSSKVLPWTGERYLPYVDPKESGVEVHYEHLHRYAFASQFVESKKVLDLASGEGYGSFLLSEKAYCVIGVDIDQNTIEHASKKYLKSNLNFIQGSICEIPVKGNKIFDVIVCFEAIEHVEDHEKLMAEIKRLIKDDGILIISTPNKKIYSDYPHYSNPFHIKELYLEDFDNLLRNYFKNNLILGQKIFPSSEIWQLSKGNNPDVCNEYIIKHTEKGFDFTGDEKEPLYYIAIASDASLNGMCALKSHLTDISSAMFKNANDRAESYRLAVVDRDARMLELGNRLDENKLRLASAEEQVRNYSNQIAEHTIRMKPIEDRVKALEKQIVVADNKLFQDNSQIIRLSEQLTDYRSQNAKLTNEIEIMQSSILWQLAMKYHNGFVLKLMPPGTRRLEYYELCLKSCRIVINEGFRSLWEKYNERKHVKKYERDLAKHVTEDRLFVETIKPVSYDPFELPQPGENIDVSIIIPVHNKIDYTYRCLKSISENTSGSYEVVVVDDASTDNTCEVLGKIKNLKVEINDTNLGFVSSCNKGGRASRGKFILFLNNDTIVQKNWLEPMVRTIGLNDVGAVGAKLVYPDGKLQEAGGIVWNDASGANYGRGDDPSKSEYNFVREVDYCSGAALLVRKDLFDALGGFDEQFKPGYYEDTDLCFAIRKMGYKVVYQPQSVVVHYEGVTSGTDLNSGMKKYQEINRSKFFEKWQTILMSDHYQPDADRYLFTARNRTAKKNILVIDHYVPTYDKDSGSLRMYNLLRILNELGYGVTFIGDNLAKLEPYTASLQQHGIEVIYHPSVSSITGYLAANGKYFDVSILSRAHIAINHVNNVRKYCVKAKIIFDTVDLQFLREMRRYEIEKDINVLAEAEKFKTMEYQIMHLCDRSWVVSPYEKDLISKDEPDIAVDVVSNIHEVHPTTNKYSERKDLLFIGGFIHKPNVDSVLWFVKDILPLIHRKNPDIKLYVVGSEPPARITSLASKNVIITGFVEDPANYFNDCRAFVAPLRYGAGIKGKINQSMSYGLPVVTTSIGAEGMGLRDGNDVLITDEPDKFAEKVMNLYNNEELWSRLSLNSIKNIQDVYSYAVNKKIIGKLLNELDCAKYASTNVDHFCQSAIDVKKETKYCCDGSTDIKKQYSQMLGMGIAQTEINKMGEIEYRKRAAFGEPDKVLAMCKSRINERRQVFKKLNGHKINLSRFLEIGSERGQTALYLANEENAFGVGLDISVESLKVSREIKKYMDYSKKPEFVCSDACRLPFKDESFDFVFCFQTLHHFATIAPLLDEIKRILKPGGHFFFAEEGYRDNDGVPIWPDQEDIEELKYNIIENAFTKEVWEREIAKFETVYVELTPLFKGYKHISALLKKRNE